MEPFDEPGVPVSCSADQLPKTSRFAEATALEGSELSVLDPVDVVVPPLLDAVPPIVNVELTTGQIPALVHTLK